MKPFSSSNNIKATSTTAVSLLAPSIPRPADFFWRFRRNWNGTYTIISKQYAGKCLAVSGSASNVYLDTNTMNFVPNDKWTLEPVYSGWNGFAD